jgi:catechol 2,3-dioxygenase-like lactoylglutathione lyase family enzyme
VQQTLRLELFVADIDRSVAFYEDVLGFARGAGDESYVPVTLGAITIGIGLGSHLQAGHPIRAHEGERNGVGVEIVVEVADVEEAHERVIASGWPVLVPPGERPWGLRDFRLLDPDGYYLRVTAK